MGIYINKKEVGEIARRAKKRKSTRLALGLGFGICRIPTEHRSVPRKLKPRKASLRSNEISSLGNSLETNKWLSKGGEETR